MDIFTNRNSHSARAAFNAFCLKRIVPVALALALMPLAALASMAAGHGGGGVIPDLGMAVADISDPFVAPVHRDDDDAAWGWCVAQGVLSDLAVDLDGDARAERLVVYVAPSMEGYDWASDDDRSGDGEWTPVDPATLQDVDLRLAVFQWDGGAYAKRADIIVAPSLVLFYANIRVSVWGDRQKYIYVRSAAARYEGVGVTYGVLSFSEGKLLCDLALVDPGFTDAMELCRVDIKDASELYRIHYRDGVSVLSDNPPASDHACTDFCDVCVGGDTGFAHGFEPIYRNANYAAALARELADFGIDDARDEDSRSCSPVCAVRFYIDSPGFFEADSSGYAVISEVIDYTGVAR